ncbi:hypothetical protein PLANPX_4649 [Lacipirellula parvula]|uniref:Uncharacterized protein n=1 Tax=Lacipirellula parvula TaxID=2650471 RepID=A0A5K7XG54_9BACT|nr:hypothetical protein PLANPX_4649 [Lacipirellula parvula]
MGAVGAIGRGSAVLSRSAQKVLDKVVARPWHRAAALVESGPTRMMQRSSIWMRTASRELT